MILLTVILLVETILSIIYLYTLTKRIERLENEINNLKPKGIKQVIKG
jgi:uncharacterized protein (UPF0335 family)